MKSYLSPEADRLDPYVPGEQPQNRQYIKLNTNESPFPPSPKVAEAISRSEIERLNLYSDPTCGILISAIAKRYGLEMENVAAGNGSDEILAFAFRAFCGTGIPAVYADITYGFYRSQTALFGIEAIVRPLREGFALNVEDYMEVPGTVFIANPNAPTGLAVPVSDIERLLQANPDRVVVVDEAYVDFGGTSCAGLIPQYENLLVVQTYSKSRNLAGARLGFCMGQRGLIAGINRVKYSFHPYNVNRLSMLAGAAAMKDTAYFDRCTGEIIRNRDWTAKRLTELGFTFPDSKANFLFAKSDRLTGEAVYRGLKGRGVLVRWFDAPRIRDHVRITIGSRDQMEAFFDALSDLLKEA